MKISGLAEKAKSNYKDIPIPTSESEDLELVLRPPVGREETKEYFKDMSTLTEDTDDNEVAQDNTYVFVHKWINKLSPETESDYEMDDIVEAMRLTNVRGKASPMLTALMALAGGGPITDEEQEEIPLSQDDSSEE